MRGVVSRINSRVFIYLECDPRSVCKPSHHAPLPPLYRTHAIGAVFRVIRSHVPVTPADLPGDAGDWVSVPTRPRRRCQARHGVRTVTSRRRRVVTSRRRDAPRSGRHEPAPAVTAGLVTEAERSRVTEMPTFCSVETFLSGLSTVVFLLLLFSCCAFTFALFFNIILQYYDVI